MNNYPKLHNATWPGLVGKGPDSEPVIPFDTLLSMTAAAEVNGVKFDGIDVGLLEPHFNLDDPDEPKRLADKVAKHNLKVGEATVLTRVNGTLPAGDSIEGSNELLRRDTFCIKQSAIDIPQKGYPLGFRSHAPRLFGL